MMAFWIKRLIMAKAVILFCLIAQTNLYAAIDLPGSNDLANFDRFPLSNIVSFEESSAPQYSLALGKIKKVNGVVFPEEQRFVTGKLKKLTYLIPSGHNTAQVSRYISDQLDKLNADILFECKARACGSSNDWANRQFKQASLYGLTGEQYYWAVELAKGDFMAIYLIQRGNRKVYLHIESVEGESQGDDLTKEQMLSRWLTGERVFVKQSDLGSDDLEDAEEKLSVLIDAASQVLDERPFSKLWLVGHQGGSNPFLILIDQSEKDAEALRQKLIDAGLPSNRIQSSGLGPLAPSYDDTPENRIDILVE